MIKFCTYTKNCREFPGGPVVRIPLACSLAEGEGSITSWKIKISEVLQCSQKRKKKIKILITYFCNVRDPGLIPELGRFPWRSKRQSTPVFLPGKSHGQRSLAGYSPWGHNESDTTEQLHFQFFHYVLK